MQVGDKSASQPPMQVNQSGSLCGIKITKARRQVGGHEQKYDLEWPKYVV